MGSYRFLEHKADVLFEAEGESFEKAMESAAEAMFSVMHGKVAEKRSFRIREEAGSLEELAVFTLSRLLSESEIREMSLARFKVKRFERGGKFVLEGTAYGEKEGVLRETVKAVTHHESRVEEKPGKVTVRILLDV